MYQQQQAALQQQQQQAQQQQQFLQAQAQALAQAQAARAVGTLVEVDAADHVSPVQDLASPTNPFSPQSAMLASQLAAPPDDEDLDSEFDQLRKVSPETATNVAQPQIQGISNPPHTTDVFGAVPFNLREGRPQSGGAAEMEQIASGAGGQQTLVQGHVMESSPPLVGGEGEARKGGHMDVFGATPFGLSGGGQAAQPSQTTQQQQQRHMSPQEADLLGAMAMEPQPESASTPRIRVGFEDDFVREGKQEGRSERLTSTGSSSGGFNLERSIRELDEFGAKPFGSVRQHRGSESSSDHEGERLSSSLRDFSYDTFDSDSIDIRKDEEHAHRGLLDQEESSEDESDDDSDHHDFDEVGAQPLIGDDGHGLSDAELASLNLHEDLPSQKVRKSEPPVAQLIDMTDDDPFSQAPFKAKTGSLKRATEPVGMCALTPPISPPMQEEDPFGEAPFNPRSGFERETSKSSVGSTGSDVFSKAPFLVSSKKRQGTGSEVRRAKTQHVSGEQTALGNPTPPISPTELGAQGVSSKMAKQEPDMFGAVPFHAVASHGSDLEMNSKEDAQQPGPASHKRPHVVSTAVGVRRSSRTSSGGRRRRSGSNSSRSSRRSSSSSASNSLKSSPGSQPRLRGSQDSLDAFGSRPFSLADDGQPKPVDTKLTFEDTFGRKLTPPQSHKQLVLPLTKAVDDFGAQPFTSPDSPAAPPAGFDVDVDPFGAAPFKPPALSGPVKRQGARRARESPGDEKSPEKMSLASRQRRSFQTDL